MGPICADALVRYRAERNAMASTTIHPTMTKAATAPAVILVFSLAMYGRSIANPKTNWTAACSARPPRNLAMRANDVAASGERRSGAAHHGLRKPGVGS